MLDGCAIALSGPRAHDVANIAEEFPGSTVMVGELYPGFFTHWGDPEFQGAKSDVSRQIKDFMRYGISFSLYVIHGGTSFGYWAGANLDPKTGEYQPDITSYDYNAPIDERGQPTPAYWKYRSLIQAAIDSRIPEVPSTPALLNMPPDRELHPSLHASIWDNLPAPASAPGNAPPQPMEHHGQASGFILYRKQGMPDTAGALTLHDVHDYATVFTDGTYIGGVTRAKTSRCLSGATGVVQDGHQMIVDRSASVLDVFVEAMGHVNYGDDLIDRKGITKSIQLNGQDLLGWQTYLLPMDAEFVDALQPVCANPHRPGLFFKATLDIDQVGDTFLDMSRWTKGVVWINGRNLGRYWNVGPQFRLFCPAPWLRRGNNEVTIFDLHQIEPKPIAIRQSAV